MPSSFILSIPARCTPVPNALLDDWMQELTDTELRVLLVVTRQTLGFQEKPSRSQPFQGKAKGSASRRARDWITHTQLKQKTGRASAAVSGAIDGLVRKRLLEVCTPDGTPLSTPQERRRWRGKMFFSLAPRLLGDS